MAGELVTENGSSQPKLGVRKLKRKLGHREGQWEHRRGSCINDYHRDNISTTAVSALTLSHMYTCFTFQARLGLQQPYLGL
jgi:hypothetical protein